MTTDEKLSIAIEALTKYGRCANWSKNQFHVRGDGYQLALVALATIGAPIPDLYSVDTGT